MQRRFRRYRDIEQGEFFVVFLDTAQGGSDKNFGQFLSQTRLDFPIVMSMHGVAAEATPYMHQALEWLYDRTKVKPVVAFERNNGGASEMHHLMQLNRGKYLIYHSIGPDGKRTDKMGYDTTGQSRSRMLGEWKVAYDANHIRIYDDETQKHHEKFIANKRGRPEAASGAHDDGVMSCAGAYQLFKTEAPPVERYEDEKSGNQRSLIY